MNELLLLIGAFFVLVLLRVPIAFAMGLSSVITAWYIGLPLNIVVRNIFEGVNSFTLLAVPFFLLAGMILNEGKVTERLLELSQALVGHIRGGLAHVNVLVSMLFAGISGSPAADTSGVGSILIPNMIRAGYGRPFSVAITAASSVIGGIIPPSISMILYGAFGNVSIGALFLGGMIPGIMVGLSQMVIGYMYARRRPELTGPAPSLRRIVRAVLGAALPMGMPVLIIGGIVFGVFTATEASVIAVVYGLLIGLAFYRNKTFTLATLPRLFTRAVVFYALPMFAVVNAIPMGWLIAYLDGPQFVATTIGTLVTGYYGIYVCIVLVLLLLGTFLSPPVTIIIFLPVLQVLGNMAGIHPVHLGVVTVMTLGIGQITPPYGICLLIAAEIGRVPVMKAFVTSLGLVAMFLLVVVICIVFPDVIMFAPRAIMGVR